MQNIYCRMIGWLASNETEMTRKEFLVTYFVQVPQNDCKEWGYNPQET
jgi:hypothetical protein